MINTPSQSGFSTVELLITLFIAVAFVTTGYQLYTLVISDSGSSRLQSRADNAAYNLLRQYSSQATKPCSVVTPTPTPAISPSDNLPNASVTVTFSCPYGTSSAISKIEVTLLYNTPQKEIVHALYVTK